MATAGTPHNFTYDVYTKEFRYEFYPNTMIASTVPTEIYVPPMVYPSQSYTITVSPTLEWEVSPENENIIFVYNGVGSSPDELAFVYIDISN